MTDARSSYTIDLRVAIRDRQPPTELIHHTDRGGQYASARYRAVLRRAGSRMAARRLKNGATSRASQSIRQLDSVAFPLQ